MKRFIWKQNPNEKESGKDNVHDQLKNNKESWLEGETMLFWTKVPVVVEHINIKNWS